MRTVSINGAVFIFMARGEKLQDADWLPSSGKPDQKFVLWPRGDGWDVRRLQFSMKGPEWRDFLLMSRRRGRQLMGIGWK